FGLWQRAQAVRRDRAGGPRRTACSVRPLVGLLRCPHCKGSMFQRGADPRHGGPGPEGAYIGYQCGSNRKLGGSACKGSHVAERPVRQAVEALLVQHLGAFDLGRWLERLAQEAIEEGHADTARELREKLAENHEKLQRLVRAVTNGT